MPEINEADIVAVNRLKESRASCSSEADVTTLLQVALAAHREAERERIMLTLHRARDDQKRAMSQFGGMKYEHAACVLARLAIAINRDAATPPEPRELTAEIVKEMLPANRTPWCADAPGWARYESPLGFIQWQYTGGEIEVWLNGMCLSLEAIGTDRKLAALVAALGIDAGVKS